MDHETIKLLLNMSSPEALVKMIGKPADRPFGPEEKGK